MARCPDHGRWRSYLDHELGAAEHYDLTDHLTTCAACRSTYAQIRQAAAFAEQQLARLAPAPDAGATRQAWLRLQPQLTRQPRVPGWAERITTVFTQLSGHPARLAATGALVSVVVVLLLALTPAGSQALQALSVFRVQTFKAITFEVDMAQWQRATKHAERRSETPPTAAAARQEVIQQLAAAGIAVDTTLDEQALHEVDSVAAAQATTGDLSVRTLADLPQPVQAGAPHVYVANPTTTKVTVDLNAFRQALRERQAGMPAGAANIDPNSLPGVSPTATSITATLRTFPGVVQAYGEGETALVFAQGASPELVLSEGIDILALRDAMLAMPGLSKTMRTQILNIKDEEWTRTLFIPVPQGTIVRDVTVGGALGNRIGGVPGLLIAQPDGKGGAVLWQQNGILYAVAGAYPEDVLLRAANSMR